MATPRPGCCAVAFMVAAMLLPEAQAQTRCEPTIANPCKLPANAATNPPGEAPKPRPATKLKPQPLLPDIRVDKDTSMGLGHGGVIGLERKF
jgi:hypothetical protein